MDHRKRSAHHVCISREERLLSDRVTIKSDDLLAPRSQDAKTVEGFPK